MSATDLRRWLEEQKAIPECEHLGLCPACIDRLASWPKLLAMVEVADEYADWSERNFASPESLALTDMAYFKGIAAVCEAITACLKGGTK